MSIFNQFAKRIWQTNHEGAEAMRVTPEYELYTAAVTGTLSDKFYESVSQSLDRLSNAAGKVTPQFLAQLAIYTRTVMNMRSMPLLLICLLARRHNGDSLVAKTIERCVLRADEIMELLVCYQLCNPQNASGIKRLGKLSNQVRRGLEAAFNQFDEYQFAKYNRKGLTVSLKDALFIVHPKAKDEQQQQIFDKIAADTLAIPYTWETELTKTGQITYQTHEMKRKAFANTWNSLIHSNRLGYMALLRNLRNIFTLSDFIDKQSIDKVLQRLDNPAEVEASRQLPFRFFAAYKELYNLRNEYTPRLLHALEGAMLTSAANISDINPNERILMACDVSGSMSFPISKKSSLYAREIGLVLAMTLRSRCPNTTVGLFGEIWKVYDIPTTGILDGVTQLIKHENEIGWATNGHLAIDWLVEQRTIVDKVMMFTDCQLWQSISESWCKYRAINPQAHLYLFDLNGYGTIPLQSPMPGVHLIAGWSEKVFDIIAAIDHGHSAIDLINKIAIG